MKRTLLGGSVLLVAAIILWKSPAPVFGAGEPGISPDHALDQARDRALDQARELSASFRSAAQRIQSSVVSIRCSRGRPPLAFEAFGLQPFFQGPAPHDGLGSGFIVRSDGVILTNHHVIRGAENLFVRLAEGDERPAQILGADPQSDLAVLKIEARDLPVAQFGDSERVEVGDWVLAVGNPFGLNRTVTAGIVSAKGRHGLGVADLESFIQTDAAINPGNSGGPLVDLQGRVIAVSTAIASASGGSVGIGFAIPARLAQRVLQQVLEAGEVRHGWLGVSIEPSEAPKGLRIVGVLQGGPAEKQGLRAGDVILRLDDRACESLEGFRQAIAQAGAEAKIRLTVLREGRQLELELGLGARPERPLLATPHDTEPRAPREPGADTSSSGSLKLGARGIDLSPERAAGLGLEGGVEVVELEAGGLAGQMGLRVGDIIEAVNGRPIRSVEDLRAALTPEVLRSGLSVSVRRRGARCQFFIQRR